MLFCQAANTGGQESPIVLVNFHLLCSMLCYQNHLEIHHRNCIKKGKALSKYRVGDCHGLSLWFSYFLFYLIVLSLCVIFGFHFFPLTFS